MPRRATPSTLLKVLVLPVLLVAALALAACGGDDGGGGGGEDATQLLKDAFSKQVDKATIDAQVDATVRGGDSPQGPLKLSLKGPFESRGNDALPLLDWEVTASGGGVAFTGGLIATAENAFVEFRGQTYEVGRELYSQLNQQARQQAGGNTSLRALGVDPVGWIESPKTAGDADVGDAETTKVTGEIDVLGLVEDLQEAAEKTNPQGTEELTDEDRKQLEDSIKEANAEVYVAKDDSTLRRLVLEIELDVPARLREQADGFEGGRFRLDVKLTDVGEEADIETPDDARPIQELLGQFGLGGGGTPSGDDNPFGTQ